MENITVCVCTRQRPDDLARTLASIAESTIPIQQVVVSDDGHDASTRRVCESALVPVEYLLGPRLGLGANRNCVLSRARGTYILFLDDDCLLGRTYVETAMRSMQEAESIYGVQKAIVSGSELRNGEPIVAQDQSFFGFQNRPYAPGEPLKTIVVNATLFPARLFELIRFDPQLHYGLDELDVATRAVAAGFHIVNAPNAQNDHRQSSLSREDYTDAGDTSRLYITARRYAVVDRRFGRAAAFAVSAPVHLWLRRVKRHGLWHGSRSAMRISMDAARKLLGSRRSGLP